MRRIVFCILALFSGTYTFAEIYPTNDSCVVVFGLSNNENIPYPSRTIVFTNKITGKNEVAETDSLGKQHCFCLKIPISKLG
jgi:hypothetical protein